MACLSSKTRPNALYKRTRDTHKEDEWISQAACSFVCWPSDWRELSWWSGSRVAAAAQGTQQLLDRQNQSKGARPIKKKMKMRWNIKINRNAHSLWLQSELSIFREFLMSRLHCASERNAVMTGIFSPLASSWTYGSPRACVYGWCWDWCMHLLAFIKGKPSPLTVEYVCAAYPHPNEIQ